MRKRKTIIKLENSYSGQLELGGSECGEYGEDHRGGGGGGGGKNGTELTCVAHNMLNVVCS